jgi:hypothetical protein
VVKAGAVVRMPTATWCRLVPCGHRTPPGAWGQAWG